MIEQNFTKKPITSSHFLYSQVKKECDGVTTPSFWPEDHANEWLCTCGWVNQQNASNCEQCNVSHDWIQAHFDRAYLSSKTMSHDREDTLSRQRAREQIKHKEKVKTSLKRGGILAIASIVLIALILLFVFVFLPSIRYEKARSLREQGQFNAAAEAFLSLGKEQEAQECYRLFDNQLAGKENAISYSSAQYPAFSIDSDGTLHVTADKLEKSNLSFSPFVVPDVVDHILVTAIGDTCFMNCTFIESMILPDNVTSIGERAFFKCSSMKSIVLPARLQELGERAFINCSSLESIVLPEGISSIAPRTFNNCSSLSSITFLGNIVSIKAYAFAGCSSLTLFNLPVSVREIGSYAFALCDALTSVQYQGSQAGFLQIVIGEHNEILLEKIKYLE